MPGNILGSIDAGSATTACSIIDALDVALLRDGGLCSPSISVIDFAAGMRLLCAGGMLSATCSKYRFGVANISSIGVSAATASGMVGLNF
jgi:hypothetical protein